MILSYSSFATELFLFLATLFILIYTYFKWCFNYWKSKGVPYVEPSFPNGSVQNPIFMKKTLGEQCKDIYDTYKPQGYKHIGFYSTISPFYMPLDADIIKSILVSDFDYFTDRGIFLNEEKEPLSANLFSLEGKRWNNMRVKLTPAFTSGKIKLMFPIIKECSNQLKQAIDCHAESHQPIDKKDVSSRFAINVIGSCAFGIDCNCFEKKHSEFTKYNNRIFDPQGLEILYKYISFAFPEAAKILGMTFFPKDSSQFFNNIIKQTLAYRESYKIDKKDLIQLLIDIKNGNRDEEGNGIGLTYNEVTAEAFFFFIAGNETTATTLAFCLFELACNLDIQQKVRDEVNKISKKYDGEITYDAMADMKYVEQVVDETLRKYPPLMNLNRKCVKPYKLPNTNIVLDKDTAVVLPVYAMHYDPEYYPEPEKFDPERFNKDNKSKINPYTYLPFGEGPRNCIGLRFGIIEVKLGLSTVIKNFKFTLNSQTKLPLLMDPFNFLIGSKNHIWLNAEKI